MILLCAISVRAQTLEPPRAVLESKLYVIQPNDVLQIFVWKEPNLNGKVLVRPDGRISFPLIQDMQAAGLNPGQLKEKIETGLKEYIDIPNVTVIVEAIQSYRIFVSGKVAKPGAYMAEKPINVLQAIALAGGTVEFANLEEIVIMRGTGEDGTMYRFNYPEVIRGRNVNQNMFLRNGDVVIVP
jgi:polysaccharide export outer membrane protein